MNMKDLLKRTNRIIPRAGITLTGEFTYNDTGAYVDENMVYHIRYTKGLKEYYVTGDNYNVTSDIINRKKGYTSFGEYTTAKHDNIFKTKFLKHTLLNLKKKDYERGIVNRYFARQSNNNLGKIIEITNKHFKLITPFYTKLQIKWSIYGDKESSIEYNLEQLKNADRLMVGIKYQIDPLSYWKPKPSAKNDVLKKLGML